MLSDIGDDFFSFKLTIENVFKTNRNILQDAYRMKYIFVCVFIYY